MSSQHPVPIGYHHDRVSQEPKHETDHTIPTRQNPKNGKSAQNRVTARLLDCWPLPNQRNGAATHWT